MEIALLDETELQPYTGFEDELRYTQKLIDQQLAYGTRRVYRSDWQRFNDWCKHRSLNAEAATPDIIALFLGSQFENGIHPSTLNRRLAAIKFAFTCRQLLSPTDHPMVRAVLKGIRRDPEAPPVQPKMAAVVSILKQLLDVIPDDTLYGLRDRAALLMGFGGAFRRSELVATQIEHITFYPGDGMDVIVRAPKPTKKAKVV